MRRSRLRLSNFPFQLPFALPVPSVAVQAPGPHFALANSAAVPGVQRNRHRSSARRYIHDTRTGFDANCWTAGEPRRGHSRAKQNFRIPSASGATARLHRRSIEWALLLYGRRLSNKRNRVPSSSNSIRACCGNRLSACRWSWKPDWNGHH